MSGTPHTGGGGPLISNLWATANPAHAIQMVVAVINLAEPLNAFIVRRLADAVRSAAKQDGLLREEPVNAVVFEMRAGAAPRASTQKRNGVIFQEIRGKVAVQTLTITEDAIRFETRNYTRWVAFRDQMANLFSQMLPILEQTSLASSISLEYVDFFYAVTEGDADAGQIIDRGSNLISRKAFVRRHPFHSHTGWFEDVTPTGHRLINVDVTVGDSVGPVGTRRTVTIRTLEAEAVLDRQSPRAAELISLGPVLEGMDALHSSLKRRLSEVLTRDASRMISLGN